MNAVEAWWAQPIQPREKIKPSESYEIKAMLLEQEAHRARLMVDLYREEGK